jgi:EAL domain-containing protein (putative c-di-GMP-specific phosphodiesterase class I)
MRLRAERQHRLTQDLVNALAERQFSVHYQPKQQLRNGDVVSVEALMRWRHPALGPISPVEFIPLLEKSGLIVEAGEWILHEACRQVHAWDAEGHPPMRVSVNVSARQLIMTDIVAVVDAALHQSGLPATSLIVEITESLLIDNLDDVRDTMKHLQTRGVQVAIDDFGTGFSSLTYLQSLPANYLKLDKSMIDALGERRGAHVVKSTIELARGLGMQTIAEGVEEARQRDTLERMGCDLIQGYLLTRPLPAGEFIEWLEKTRLERLTRP